MATTPMPKRRRWSWWAVILIGTAVLLTLLFVVAMVIHFILLSTDRFNWLEPART